MFFIMSAFDDDMSREQTGNRGVAIIISEATKAFPWQAQPNFKNGSDGHFKHLSLTDSSDWLKKYQHIRFFGTSMCDIIVFVTNRARRGRVNSHTHSEKWLSRRFPRLCVCLESTSELTNFVGGDNYEIPEKIWWNYRQSRRLNVSARNTVLRMYANKIPNSKIGRSFKTEDGKDDLE